MVKLKSFLSLNELSQHFYSGWNIAFSPRFVFFSTFDWPECSSLLISKSCLVCIVKAMLDQPSPLARQCLIPEEKSGGWSPWILAKTLVVSSPVTRCRQELAQKERAGRREVQSMRADAGPFTKGEGTEGISQRYQLVFLSFPPACEAH